MTTRLYYDSPVTAFDAVVVTCDAVAGKFHVVLDRTAFYPTSGGQPFDRGTLGGTRVVDVVDRDDGEVVHVTEATIAVGSAVHGEIEAARRFDHMQQHTGQHVLSAAFDRLLGVRTVSFHLGTEISTIDLSREVTADEIVRAEDLANQVVWEDRPVTVRTVSEEEAGRLPLRKDPGRTGPLRLVDVQDFDVSACGGTHVARTGTIGIIAVAASERFKGATRLSFVCGGRALRSHRALRDVVLNAIRVFSVTPGELKPALERLQAEQKEQARVIRKLQETLAGYRANEIRSAAETIGRYFVVLRTEPEMDASSLKTLAVAVVEGSGRMAAVVGGGEPAPVVIARSSDVNLDAAALMRELTAALGGRGGGKPDLAQGGVSAPPEQIVAFLRSRISEL